MSRPASDIAGKLAQRARGIDSFVKKLERLHREGRLTRTDVERAYAGAFLSFFAFYENKWEELFLGVLMSRIDHPRPIEPLVVIRSEAVARKIAQGGARHLDWLPADISVDRAERFLRQGRPFSEMTPNDKKVVMKYMAVRNVLAHESQSAKKRFQKEVLGSGVFPPHERRPAGYLRGAHAVGQTRMNLSLAELTNVFNRLCS